MRPSRVVFVTICLATLVFAAISTVGSPTGRAATGQPDSGRSTQPTITLDALDPWINQNRTVVATVHVRNAPKDATLVPVLHRAVTTRSGFAATMKGTNLGGVTATLGDRPVDASDKAITVRFHVGEEPPEPSTVDTVALTEPGVHPLVFSLKDSSGDEVASMVTYVVRLPDASENGNDGREPLRIASQFRLSPEPVLDENGDLNVSDTTLADTRALIDGIDRPSAKVRAGLSFTVSPALVDALATTHDTQTLDELDQVTDGLPLQSQPWSPVDPAGWLATPGLTERLEQSVQHGDSSLTKHLHEPEFTIVDLAGWGGRISEPSLQWFTKHGAQAVVVAQGALRPLDEVAFPRTLAAPFDLRIGDGRTVTAVQTDSGISAHFANPDPILGANQLIADLSVIALDLPSISRMMIVAPPTRWRPSKPFLSAFLAALENAKPSGSESLLVPMSAAEAIQRTPPARAAGDLATQGDVLERSLRRSAAPAPMTALADQLKLADQLIESTASMVPGGAAASHATTDRMRRQTDIVAMPGVTADDRKHHIDAITAQANATARSIRLPPRQTITLTSNTASLPITIRRSSSGPTRVTVHIDAPDRLQFPDGRSQLVQLDESTTRLNIRIHSDSPGDSMVRLSVTSPDGRLVSGTTELVVRSTAASGVGFVISLGSLLFLIIWWGRDLIRRRRHRRAQHIPPAQLIDIDTSERTDV